MNNLTRLLTIFAVLLIVTSCSRGKKAEISAAEAYVKAMEILKNKDYSFAAEEFEKIEEEFPFSKWAMKSQVMAAYSYYKIKEYDDVVRMTDYFVKMNPAHKDTPYMYYIKALSYYDRMTTVDRGQDNAQGASSALRELVARYPASKYTHDSRKKLKNVVDHLVGAKMSVGRFYLKNDNYIGAITCFNEVVDRYGQSRYSLEAHYRLIEAYQALGMNEEAKLALNTLKNASKAKEKPNNRWLIAGNKLLF